MGIHQCPMDAKLDDEAERKIAAFQKSLNEKGAGDHVDFVRFEHESCVFFIQPAEHFAKMSDVAHSEANLVLMTESHFINPTAGAALAPAIFPFCAWLDARKSDPYGKM